MSEAVAVRARPQGEDERCPYCHDLVAPGEQPAAMITCPGCATAHHAECVAELGRCTVLGCERPLEAPAGFAADSFIGREVRRRLGDRARSFVSRNARSVPPVDLEAARVAIQAAAEEVERSEGRARLAALDRLIELEVTIGRGLDRSDIAGWMPLAQARRARRRELPPDGSTPRRIIPVPGVSADRTSTPSSVTVVLLVGSGLALVAIIMGLIAILWMLK